MTLPLQQVYTEQVYIHLGPMYGHWEPGSPVQIGDYGLLTGRRFDRIGNISTLGASIPATTKVDDGSHRHFSSSQSTQVEVRTKADTGGEAEVEIKFSGSTGVFFNAAGCHYSAVADKLALGIQLEALGRFGTASGSA